MRKSSKGHPLPEQGNKQFGVLHSAAGPGEAVVHRPPIGLCSCPRGRELSQSHQNLFQPGLKNPEMETLEAPGRGHSYAGSTCPDRFVT